MRERVGEKDNAHERGILAVEERRAQEEPSSAVQSFGEPAAWKRLNTKMRRDWTMKDVLRFDHLGFTQWVTHSLHHVKV